MFEEESKAVTEVAKTTNNAINKASELGQFLAGVFGPAIEDIGDIAAQYTEYWKIKNAISIKNKLDNIIKERGSPTLRALPLRIGIPLLDAAVIEDEESLQLLWANLLASTLTKKEGDDISVTKSYVETLKQLDVEDAHYLSMLFAVQPRILAKGNSSFFVNSSGKRSCVDMSITVHNLERLGLIDVHQSKTDPCEEPIVEVLFNGGENKDFVSFKIFASLTLFGFHFMRACTDEKLLMEGREIVPTDHRFRYFDKATGKAIEKNQPTK